MKISDNFSLIPHLFGYRKSLTLWDSYKCGTSPDFEVNRLSLSPSISHHKPQSLIYHATFLLPTEHPSFFFFSIINLVYPSFSRSNQWTNSYVLPFHILITFAILYNFSIVKQLRTLSLILWCTLFINSHKYSFYYPHISLMILLCIALRTIMH